MTEETIHFIAFRVLTVLGLLVVSRLIQRVFGVSGLADLVLAKANTARAIEQAGNAVAVFIIAAAVTKGCVHGKDWALDLLWTAVFGVSSVGLVIVTSRLGIQLLLGTRLPGEIARNNVAASVAAAGHTIATGVIIARCLYGDSIDTLGVSFVFFALGQVSLHLLVVLFRVITAYDDREEILGDNLAAATSYAGVTIALGLIIGHAAEGTFVSWQDSLASYGLALLICVALYPVRQIVVQLLILGAGFSLRGGRLDHGIAQERNVGMGVLEASAYLATAVFAVAVA